MSDYYIRTPDQDESRGPFNIAKLLTLAEAGQINENTLFYDEDEEEWIPFALNEELKAKVFPVREKLSLKIGVKHEEEIVDDDVGEDAPAVDIADMLKAAEGETEETRHLKSRQKSFDRATAIGTITLGLMMLFSAISFIVPHLSVIQAAVNEQNYPAMLNFPFLLVGVFDLVMAVLLLLSVTEIYPLVRARGALGFGFGLYVGWALGDPLLLAAFGLAGLGIFIATISQKFSVMLLASIAGIAANAFLAYLALSGRFSEFYSVIRFGAGGG